MSAPGNSFTLVSPKTGAGWCMRRVREAFMPQSPDQGASVVHWVPGAATVVAGALTTTGGLRGEGAIREASRDLTAAGWRPGEAPPEIAGVSIAAHGVGVVPAAILAPLPEPVGIDPDDVAAMRCAFITYPSRARRVFVAIALELPRAFSSPLASEPLTGFFVPASSGNPIEREWIRDRLSETPLPTLLGYVPARYVPGGSLLEAVVTLRRSPKVELLDVLTVDNADVRHLPWGERRHLLDSMWADVTAKAALPDWSPLVAGPWSRIAELGPEAKDWTVEARLMNAPALGPASVAARMGLDEFALRFGEIEQG